MVTSAFVLSLRTTACCFFGNNNWFDESSRANEAIAPKVMINVKKLNSNELQPYSSLVSEGRIRRFMRMSKTLFLFPEAAIANDEVACDFASFNKASA